MKNPLLLFLFLFSLPHERDCFAQNLVPNPSFEDTVACPNTLAQIDKAVGWSSYSITPDYFNSCSGSIVGIPSNYFGFQNAFDGNAYAGFVNHLGGSNIREYIGVQLTQPLVFGTKYFVSFYVSRGSVLGANKAINKIGAKFSTVAFSNTNPQSISNVAQIYTDSIISDTLNWVKISGSFIADSAYQYLSIGNFFNDSLTAYVNYDSLGGGAYYYLDLICVSQDSLTCNSLPKNIKENIFNDGVNLFPNPTSDFLNLSFPAFRDAEVGIYDRLGRQVFSPTMRNHPELTINLGAFSPGVYLLKLVSEKDGRVVVRKVVKL